jgi:uncharacterized repeat protein (TIGR03803 family)
MDTIMSSAKLALALLVFLPTVVAVPSAWAQTYTVLYSFTGGADGASPKGSLVLDSASNLYGTTLGSNPYPSGQMTGTTAGSVFKITPGGSFTLLYNFGPGGANGTSPSGGLVRDSAGNLYGATSGGGASTNPTCIEGGSHPSLPLDGCGEVFKVDANGNFSVFFSFSGQSLCGHGCWPLAPLTLDPAGNLYGTTFLGGSRDCDSFNLGVHQFLLNTYCGVVFRLDPQGKETVLHRFGKARRDGDFPNPGLILDAAGNLYGTTLGGGINSNGGNGGAGTVFKLDPAGNETVLFYFEEFVSDDNPHGGLIQDAAGNLYGTAQNHGTGHGAFKLDPQGNLTRLPGVGGTPLAGFIMDVAGNLYDTTFDGGNLSPNCGFFGNGDCGTVFKLDASGNFTVVYNFSGGADGDAPYAGLVMDAAGNLFGTAAYGGTVNSNCPAGCGVVFKITP